MLTKDFAVSEEQQYSFEEYLVLEEKADYKSEYEQGRILAMSGGTLDHSTISQNTATAIANALKLANKRCRVNNSALKIRIEAYDKGVYPDVSVICEQADYYKERKDVITNPLLIVEVLSKSTRDYDRGTKFKHYRSLSSLREYVLIEQDIAKVESWYKIEDNVWRISNATGLDASISLYSLDCEIQLSDVYYLIDRLKEK